MCDGDCWINARNQSAFASWFLGACPAVGLLCNFSLTIGRTQNDCGFAKDSRKNNFQFCGTLALTPALSHRMGEGEWSSVSRRTQPLWKLRETGQAVPSPVGRERVRVRVVLLEIRLLSGTCFCTNLTPSPSSAPPCSINESAGRKKQFLISFIERISTRDVRELSVPKADSRIRSSRREETLFDWFSSK